jgi:D-glycero-alpha-D-manno-heptose 1-phosphate guanylyltransferase
LIKQAIILAGGFGTRLQSTVPDIPKCLAIVNGRPFLQVLIRYLLSQGVQKMIFSLGYKHELVEEFLQKYFPALDYHCVIEEQPLGTGGAIALALQHTSEQNVLVANGDTLFKADLPSMHSRHEEMDAECTLALKPMKHFDRYGVVDTDKNGRVTGFLEKKFSETGNINGGLYILDKEKFLSHTFPEKFSFETDYLENFVTTTNIAGWIDEGYFIDIGVPEDYLRAQAELKQIPLDLRKTGRDWTVFLDRDGVINYEKENDYIYNWDEFRFYPDALDSIRMFSNRFGKTIVVSNQRGVEKKLMTEQSLQNIHRQMKKQIVETGGRIDGIYYCTEIAPKSYCRKPNPGMALQAAKDLGVDLSKAIMVGNKLSDMQFGRNAGMFTVYLRTTHLEQSFPHPDIDLCFDSLEEFAKAL